MIISLSKLKTLFVLVLLIGLVLYLLPRNSTKLATTVLIYDDKADGLGDREAVERLKIAAQNLEWDIVKHGKVVKGYNIDSYSKAIAILIERGEKTPKILKLAKYPKIIKKYLIIWGAHPNFLEENSFAQLIEHYNTRFNANVEGYLVTYPKQLLFFQGVTLSTNTVSSNEDKLIMTWYPTVYKTNYQNLSYKKIMFSGGGWDELRQSEKYREVYKRLADKEMLVVYGSKEHISLWNYIKDSYRGFIPADGKSFLVKAAENGITLVLHSQWHLDNKVPSARVFEGAAASTIMICDNHPFIKKEFGDTVLYIDHTADAEAMFQQINNHILWIKSHPQEVAIKTKKAHEIFSQKFTLESQLQKLSFDDKSQLITPIPSQP